VIAAALALSLAASAPAAGFGDSSMGKKPYGVLLLTPDSNGAWKTNLASFKAQLGGAAIGPAGEAITAEYATAAAGLASAGSDTIASTRGSVTIARR